MSVANGRSAKREHAQKQASSMLERWMTPSLFVDTEASDEYSLSSLGETYRKRIKEHHRSFITEADFRWLKKQRVEIIRLPIGYWIFGDSEPFVKAITTLDWAFHMADKYGLKILLDIHGAPGSQNGEDHSGKKGECAWAAKPENQRLLHDSTVRLVQRYREHSSFWGISLLNEPHVRLRELFVYWRYYRSIVKEIREIAPKLQIVIDGYQPWYGVIFALRNHTTLDLHFYPAMGKNRHRTNEQILRLTRWYRYALLLLNEFTPVIIGEWSAAMGHYYDMLPPDEKADMTMKYIQSQLKAFDAAQGHFFWSYKTTDGGLWSFRDMVESEQLSIT